MGGFFAALFLVYGVYRIYPGLTGVELPWWRWLFGIAAILYGGGLVMKLILDRNKEK